jgi:CTP:molybdopterin cytidylyltransferase MocA
MAITRDLVDKALAGGAFASIIVSTNDRVLAESVSGLSQVIVELDPEDEAFHFGKRLQSLIAEYKMERVVYLGGGSAPLLPASTLNELAERLRATDHLFLANNFYSVDFCAFTPASALLAVEPPANDNGLGWLLATEAKLPARELERTGATMFDVDTPVDLMTLSLHPDVPPHTRAYLDGLDLDMRHVEAASTVLLKRRAEVLVAGRISSQTMAYLEREALCRTRIFSEERGMRADGRLERGEVRSLLGMHGCCGPTTRSGLRRAIASIRTSFALTPLPIRSSAGSLKRRCRAPFRCCWVGTHWFRAGCTC